MRAGVGGVDPAGRGVAGAQVQPHQLGHAQAAAVQQLDDAVVARAQRRIAGVGSKAGQRHRLVDRQRLGQRLGALGARTPSTGLAATTPLRPHQRYRPRQADRCDGDAARRQRRRSRSCAAQRRTWCGCTSRSATWASAADCCSRSKRVVHIATRARRQAALDAQVLEVALQLGRQRVVHGRFRPAAATGGAGDLADARQELGAHVGRVARRVGRAQHQQAEGVQRAGLAQRHHRHRQHAAPASSSQRDGLEAGIDAAVGQRQAGGEGS